jgi:putative hydrolase of the HAD superfamily
MQIAAMLFDLGGTVCRYLPERRLAALAAGCGRPAAEVRALLWDAGLDGDFDRGRYTAAGMYDTVRRRLGLRMDYARFRATWALAFEPDAEMLAVVDAVRAAPVRTALFTNNGPVLLEAIPELFPRLAARFDLLLFSCVLGALKPEPAAFQAALTRLDERPERVLLVDDSPPVVEAARTCGMHAVVYTSPEAVRRELAAYVPVTR